MGPNNYTLLNPQDDPYKYKCCHKKELLRFFPSVFFGVIFYTSFIVATFVIVNRLPPSTSIKDASFNSFSAERALKHIHNLTVDIGPRPFGSVGNHRAKDYIISEIERIRKSIPESSDLVFQWKVSSHNGTNDFRTHKGYYETMNNIIVSLRWEKRDPIHEPIQEPTDDVTDETDTPTDDVTDEPNDETDNPTDDVTDEPTDETDEPTDETDTPTDETDETDNPTDETDNPTDEPTDETDEPTDETDNPTDEPTDETDNPTDEPTDETDTPTDETDETTDETDNPTDEPTDETDNPTDEPTDETDNPTDEPTDETDNPTDEPTDETDTPTDDVTDEPTDDTTDEPTDDGTDDAADDFTKEVIDKKISVQKNTLKFGNESLHTMLFSGHYDSVAFSPGAYDDASSIGALLELLELISMNENLHIKDKYNAELIFLFNNAEELNLIGSTDFTFIDPDVNVSNIDGFINIDSTPGEKPILFRSTGTFLDYHYKNTKRPYGYIIGHDIFKMGFIKSDTDFTIFKKKINNGLDISYFSKRHVYHTTNDKAVKPGSIQFLGDNLLSLIQSIYDKESSHYFNKDKMKANQVEKVYFSIFDSILVIYTLKTSLIFHIVLTVLYVVLFFFILVFQQRKFRMNHSLSNDKGPIFHLVIGFIYILLTYVIIMVLSLIISFLISLYNPYFYYANYGLALSVYLLFTIFLIYLLHGIFNVIDTKLMVSNSIQRQRLFYGHQLFILIILIISTIFSKSYGSTYITFFYCLMNFFSLILFTIGIISGIINSEKEYPITNIKKLKTYESMDDDDDVNIDSHERSTLLSRNVKFDDSKYFKKAQYIFTELYWTIIFIVSCALPLILFTEVVLIFAKLVSSIMTSSIISLLVPLLFILIHIPFIIILRGIHIKSSRYFFCISFIVGFTFVILLLASTLPNNPRFNKDYPLKISLKHVYHSENDSSYLQMKRDTIYSPWKSLKDYFDDMKIDYNITCPKDDTCESFDIDRPNFIFDYELIRKELTDDSYFDMGIQFRTTNESIHLIYFNKLDDNNDIRDIKINGNEIPLHNFTILLKDIETTNQWFMDFLIKDSSLNDVEMVIETFSNDEQTSPVISNIINKMTSETTVLGAAIGNIVIKHVIKLSELGN